jgi:hypothetical protein
METFLNHTSIILLYMTRTICIDVNESRIVAFSRKIFPDSILIYLNLEITDQDRIPVEVKDGACL